MFFSSAFLVVRVLEGRVAFWSGLFMGHDPALKAGPGGFHKLVGRVRSSPVGSSQEVFEISRVWSVRIESGLEVS